MNHIVDARGKACPLPVIEAKKALEKQGAPVIVLVDNEIACQNVEKMAAQLGYAAQPDMLEDGTFRVLIQTLSGELAAGMIGGAASPAAPAAAASCLPMDVAPAGPTVVVISSACMGTGDDTLGAALMKGFIYALTQLERTPDIILLYNGGARLSTEGADTVEDLKLLAQNGAEILTCGTCLKHYGLEDKLSVGEVTNMYAIAEALARAGKVIRP